MAEPVRLVAVLGYSHRRDADLNAICAERLAAAEVISDGAAAVLLSGWARRHGDSEAELMRAAWRGPEVPLVVDAHARTTAGNAHAIASTAQKLGATEVVAVTSAWHRPRARLLLRAALGRDIRLAIVSAGGARPPRVVLRELACLAALPLQLTAARRARR